MPIEIYNANPGLPTGIYSEQITTFLTNSRSLAQKSLTKINAVPTTPSPAAFAAAPTFSARPTISGNTFIYAPINSHNRTSHYVPAQPFRTQKQDGMSPESRIAMGIIGVGAAAFGSYLLGSAQNNSDKIEDQINETYAFGRELGELEREYESHPHVAALGRVFEAREALLRAKKGNNGKNTIKIIVGLAASALLVVGAVFASPAMILVSTLALGALACYALYNLSSRDNQAEKSAARTLIHNVDAMLQEKTPIRWNDKATRERLKAEGAEIQARREALGQAGYEKLPAYLV